MTFLSDLARLREAATKWPWHVVNEPIDGNPYWRGDGTEIVSDYGRIADFDCNGLRDKDDCKANAEFIAYLVNHAEAIEGLVRAAENVSKILDHPTRSVTILDASKLREALEELNRSE